MATIEIPDELYARLAKTARVRECTVEEVAADLIRSLHVPLDRDEYKQLLEKIRALPPIESDLDPVALIREDRDNR